MKPLVERIVMCVCEFPTIPSLVCPEKMLSKCLKNGWLGFMTLNLIHSFNTYYCVPGADLGTLNKTDKDPCPHGVYALVGGDNEPNTVYGALYSNKG